MINQLKSLEGKQDGVYMGIYIAKEEDRQKLTAMVLRNTGIMGSNIGFMRTKISPLFHWNDVICPWRFCKDLKNPGLKRNDPKVPMGGYVRPTCRVHLCAETLRKNSVVSSHGRNDPNSP